MGETSFFIRLGVVLCLFALAVVSQSSDNSNQNRPRIKDNEPDKCSCPATGGQADVSVKPTGCNAATFQKISSELEDARRQLRAAASAGKTSISSELEETRHQVEKLQMSVSSSRESVSSELRDVRQQLDELKTSVSAVVDILKGTLLVEEAVPNNASERTENTPATSNNIFPTDKARTSVATERSELVTTAEPDVFPTDKARTSVATERSELVTTAEPDVFPTDKARTSVATERSELVTTAEPDIFPTDKARTSDATERTELVTTAEPVILAKDCSEILARGASMSGVYTVQPLDSGEAFQVYCDMETDGGGWTLFQRRQDGSVDFYLDFANFSRGFGNLEGEFWLGNDNLHRLTAQGEYQLRIDLSDFEDESRYAVYDSFSITDVSDNYRLKVQGYSGTAGNSMRLHNNRPFSTKDRDNDRYSGNCAAMFHGAWWYNACHMSNLNGEYLGGLTAEFSRGVNWQTWKGFLYSLRTSEMKIRMK